MSVDVALGLTLQVLAVAIVLVSLRRKRMGFLGVLFVGVAFAYHGIGELLQLMIPTDGLYRFIVPSSTVASWLPIVGAAMLGFAIAYVVTLSVSRVGPRADTSWWPSTTLMCGVAFGFWALAVGVAVLSPGFMTYWGDGLIQQFLLIALATAAILVVRQAGTLATLATLLALALGLSLTGQRGDVISAVVVVVWATTLMGRPITWRAFVPFGAALVLVALLISAARADVGRRFQTGDLAVRAAALQAGATSLRGGNTGGLADDFVYRLDGNAWAAFVQQRQDALGRPSVTEGLAYDLKLVVPSFLDSSKLDTPVWQRNEEAYFDHAYAIPAVEFDWLPTLFGSAFAYGGAWGLVAFALVLGVGLARLDVWLRRGLTFPSLIIGIGVAFSITHYEQGFDSVLVNMRGALLVWLVARMVGWFREAARSAAPARRVPVA